MIGTASPFGPHVPICAVRPCGAVRSTTLPRRAIASRRSSRTIAGVPVRITGEPHEDDAEGGAAGCHVCDAVFCGQRLDAREHSCRRRSASSPVFTTVPASPDIRCSCARQASASACPVNTSVVAPCARTSRPPRQSAARSARGDVSNRTSSRWGGDWSSTVEGVSVEPANATRKRPGAPGVRNRGDERRRCAEAAAPA